MTPRARREAETTIRLAIEKGQQLDPQLIEKMLPRPRNPHRDDLLAGGIVVLAVAGLASPILIAAASQVSMVPGLVAGGVILLSPFDVAVWTLGLALLIARAAARAAG